ncbi:hypothetical protein SBA1_550060 [Candidatus Sulfotelmatobacter kueseliae]|uniref:Uncharacterized protein n=1 Tax=Candidatus Sulfotelmatobacter kueseliae TaxID=2042962 RepID=A0A2U3KYF9_9BACT|nr:hypothetical protein SBA1_550060 [Candidatus Sulfotelmatobacter kueseliae]
MEPSTIRSTPAAIGPRSCHYSMAWPSPATSSLWSSPMLSTGRLRLPRPKSGSPATTAKPGRNSRAFTPLWFPASHPLVTSVSRNLGFPANRITKVTFTKKQGDSNIHSWFGSSGGGLPRRPGLKSRGRFSFSAFLKPINLSRSTESPGGRLPKL